MSFDPWDRELRERAQREDCPIPEGFSTRLEEQLERLPERSRGRKWGRRRILVLLAAALALTACTAGTVSIALRQNTIRQVKNEGAGRWEVIKAEEAGEPTPEVHVRENLPGDYEPLPFEEMLENMSEIGYTLVSREQGGPEDDWRERCIWEDGQAETQTVYYWADSMADLESFWPEVVPHAFWLDGQYTPSPMGMSYGYDADLATGEVWGRYFSGEYTGEDGAAFEFGFTYNARYTWPDWYSVDLTGQEYQEQYETKDGAVVSIEIIPSVTGKSVFYTAISTEHTTLHTPRHPDGAGGDPGHPGPPGAVPAAHLPAGTNRIDAKAGPPERRGACFDKIEFGFDYRITLVRTSSAMMASKPARDMAPWSSPERRRRETV